MSAPCVLDDDLLDPCDASEVDDEPLIEGVVRSDPGVLSAHLTGSVEEDVHRMQVPVVHRGERVNPRGGVAVFDAHAELGRVISGQESRQQEEEEERLHDLPMWTSSQEWTSNQGDA